MFEIEGMGNSTFLVYKTEEKSIDSLGIGMLTNNKIEGLLSLSSIQKDENKFLNYNVTAMIPLAQYFENYLNKEQVIRIFINIVKGLISAEEYMLDIKKLLLDKEYIYIEVNGENCKLLYLPLKERYEQRSLVEIFKKLLLEIKYDAQADNAYMTELINYLNANPELDCKSFEKWLSELLVQSKKESLFVREEKRQEPIVENIPLKEIHGNDFAAIENIAVNNETKAGKKSFSFSLGSKRKEEKQRVKQLKKEEKKKKKESKGEKNISVNPYFDIPNQNKNISQNIDGLVMDMQSKNSMGQSSQELIQMPKEPQIERGRLDFGDTVISNEMEESSTVILSSNMQIADGLPYLKRVKNGQKMYIDKSVIKIGREGKYVDLYIGDNPSISRSHADILKENNEYFIRDNNSNNHTYVEDNMLLGGHKARLEHGMRIRMADEEFIFYLY